MSLVEVPDFVWILLSAATHSLTSVATMYPFISLPSALL